MLEGEKENSLRLAKKLLCNGQLGAAVSGKIGRKRGVQAVG